MFKEELRPRAADPLLFALAPIISATCGVRGVRRRAVRRRDDALRPARRAAAAAGRRRQRRRAGDLRHRVDERLRDRARRLELEQQVLAARRPALVGADDQLRAVVRPGARQRAADRQLAVAHRHRQRPGRARGSAFIPRWFVFLQPLGFLIYMTAGIAETNRAPFDFPEAEQELVAGYHTEYSSMSFAMFFLAEYINMVTVSAVATDLFLGGWHGPFLPESLGWIWFLIKVGAILFFYVWMRWTLPRYRYDQLMAFGWKVLLPLSVRQPARHGGRGAVLRA